MPLTAFQIKEKLLSGIDDNNKVTNMQIVVESLALLENMVITREILEKTRLGKHVNELRKNLSNNVDLGRRAKNLVRKWRLQLLSTPEQNKPVTQTNCHAKRKSSTVVAKEEHHSLNKPSHNHLKPHSTNAISTPKKNFSSDLKTTSNGNLLGKSQNLFSSSKYHSMKSTSSSSSLHDVSNKHATISSLLPPSIFVNSRKVKSTAELAAEIQAKTADSHTHKSQTSLTPFFAQINRKYLERNSFELIVINDNAFTIACDRRPSQLIPKIKIKTKKVEVLRKSQSSSNSTSGSNATKKTTLADHLSNTINKTNSTYPKFPHSSSHVSALSELDRNSEMTDQKNLAINIVVTSEMEDVKTVLTPTETSFKANNLDEEEDEEIDLAEIYSRHCPLPNLPPLKALPPLIEYQRHISEKAVISPQAMPRPPITEGDVNRFLLCQWQHVNGNYDMHNAWKPFTHTYIQFNAYTQQKLLILPFIDDDIHDDE